MKFKTGDRVSFQRMKGTWESDPSGFERGLGYFRADSGGKDYWCHEYLCRRLVKKKRRVLILEEDLRTRPMGTWFTGIPEHAEKARFIELVEVRKGKK